jgi:hypothetical protein
LVDVDYDAHYRINHSKSFSNGSEIHINGIENSGHLQNEDFINSETA